MRTFSGKKVLITGADGFIGKNLALALNELGDIEILKFVRGDTYRLLERLLSNADVLIHLAGENRPESPEMFDIVNIGLSEKLAEILYISGSKIPIIFTSSIQASANNDYGRSKLGAEKVLERLCKENGNPIHIFRLPGVFGKGCKPYYNSVVATFCHNVATHKKLRIDNPDHKIDLVYIDDVIRSFFTCYEKDHMGMTYEDVTPSYNIGLGELATQIEAFDTSRSNLFVDSVGLGLVRALYSTYISYLPASRFSYEIPSYGDERGVFVEVLKTANAGQFSYFTAKQGVTRGGHYHHTKSEKFLVLRGDAKFKFRNIITNETVEINVSGARPTVVDTIPGWAHDITNVGTEEMIVMLWANEIFDRLNPDTISAKV